MTRVLYWNIQDFARNKIDHPRPAKKAKRQKGSSLPPDVASQQRLDYILRHFAIAPAPDIFILVELETAYAAPGRLVTGNGWTGAETLLEELQALDASWALVPPLQTGPNEGVAVYYRRTRRYFTGPYVWPGGAGVVAAAPGGATGDYPAAYRDGLPSAAGARGNVPAGAQHNAGVAERRCAARVEFTDRNLLAPGNAKIYAGLRAPYMVTFAETNAMGVVTRNLTIFAIHAPANAGARAYLRELADLDQVVNGLGATEVRVIAGDFNWNLLHADLTPSASYAVLTAPPASYTLLMNPPALPPAPVNGYADYFATHIKTSNHAQYWSQGGVNTYYPGYGYTGSERIAGFYAIDNIYARYGAGGPAANFTILNGVVGSPFNLNLPAPAGAPQGTVVFADDMTAVAPFNAPPAVGPPVTAGLRKSFRGWDNYGHVRSTSDHLALVVDV